MTELARLKLWSRHAQVVRVLQLKFGGPGFKSSTLLLTGFVLSSPPSPSSTPQLYCVNSQLVCLLPVGIFLPAFHVYLKHLFLKSLHKCYINYKLIFIFFFPHDHKTIHLIDACTRLLFSFFLRICYEIK